MKVSNQNKWTNEISKLKAATTSLEERQAIECFERALTPLLGDPNMLRSMLGKIQMAMLTENIEGQLTTVNFDKLEDIARILPSGVSAHLEAVI